MDTDAGDVVADEFHLAGVEPSADLETQRGQRVAKFRGAADGAAGPVEGGENSLLDQRERTAASDSHTPMMYSASCDVAQ
jgi:hypothetical protein